MNNRDPEQRGRVQLRIPAVLGNEVHPAWALPMGQHFGQGTGRLLVPHPETVVFVQFLDGDPNRPLWMPGPWVESPPEVQSNQLSPPMQGTYPRKRLLWRSRRNRITSILENEQGDLNIQTEATVFRLENPDGRIELEVRGGPDGKVVVNQPGEEQFAARKGDRVSFGALSVTTGPSGVTAVLWHPPGDVPPITLTTVPTEITGAIIDGSPSVMIGD